MRPPPIAFAAALGAGCAIDPPDVASTAQPSVVQVQPPWGLDRIDQKELPVDGRFVQLGTGEGTTIYVIGTGIRSTHADLTGRVLAGHSEVPDGAGTDDCTGNGTHIAAIAAGTQYGVAKRAQVVPVRVVDCGGLALERWITGGLDWVAAHHAPQAVALVGTTAAGSPAIDASVRALVAAGVPVVAMSGGSTRDACELSPAREPLAITVGATTQTDARASYSNFGACLDLFAPGDAIMSAAIAGDTATTMMNGTSMAAAHVAGVAAGYLGSHLGATPAELATALLGGATRDLVTDPRGAPNLLLSTGFMDSEAPVVAITSPTDGEQVGGEVTVTVDVAEDNLERVVLWIDERLVGTRTAPPFDFAVAGLTDGAHAVTAVAYDRGARSTTHSLTIWAFPDGRTSPGTDPHSREPSDDFTTGGCATSSGDPTLLVLALVALARRCRRV